LAFGWAASALAVPPLPAPVLVDNGGIYTQGIPDLPVGNNGYTRPEDNPAPPGDSFNPPVSTNSPASGAPAVTTFTPQAGNDRTVLIQGAAFTTFSGNDAGKDARLWSTDATGAVYQPQILRVANQALAVLMSPLSGTYGMYLLWAENAKGAGYPVRVNGTDGWWIGPNHAVIGSSVSVYGRNLSYQNGTGSSWVFIRPWGASAGTSSIPCTVTRVNPYKVTFTVPGNLAGGIYEVWIHNGHGGRYGWSGPLGFTVDSNPVYQWNGTVRNVRATGAYGDGVHDDQAALQNTIYSSSPGDIVYLPAGNYLISRRLNLVNGIAIQGAGAASTTISMYSSSYYDVAMLNSHWCSTNLISSLTLSNGFSSTNLLWGMYVADYGNFAGVPYGIIISSCNFATAQNVNSAAINIGGVHDLWVTNCTFTMSGDGVAIGCAQAFVNNNTFLGNASVNTPTALGCNSGQESDYSGNTAACLNRTNNQAVCRLFTSGSNGGTVRNVYVGDNSCSQCGPLPPPDTQNAGEMILWENEHVDYTGSPVAVGPTTLSYTNVNWATNQFTSTTLYIDNGPGMGAWRRIVSNTTNTIRVDHTWDVWPTSASHTLLVNGGVHTVTYHNTLDGVPDYATRNIAGSGVQPGVSFDTIIANNIITHSRGAIPMVPNVQPTNQQDRLAVGSFCNNLVVGNVISNSTAGIGFAASVWMTGSGSTVFGPLVLNNVVRDNAVANIDTTGMSIDQGYDTWDWPWQQHNLFEHNAAVDCNTQGMQVGQQQAYTLIRRNSFSRTDQTLTTGINFGSQDLWPYLYENTFGPQISPFAGTPPGGGQNLGARRFDFHATAGGASPPPQTATLWNIGTALLHVSCSSDQSWLSASSSPTTLAPGATATVTVTVNHAGLNAGFYSGTVTVTGGLYATPETLWVSLLLDPAPPIITSITRSGNDIDLAWSTTGGTTNTVQFATGDLAGRNPSWSFTDLSGDIVIPGNGAHTTYFTHTGAATNWPAGYYRVRLVP
jgi:hypothetical protein